MDTAATFEGEPRVALEADRAMLIDARADPAACQDSFGATFHALALNASVR